MVPFDLGREACFLYSDCSSSSCLRLDNGENQSDWRIRFNGWLSCGPERALLDWSVRPIWQTVSCRAGHVWVGENDGHDFIKTWPCSIDDKVWFLSRFAGFRGKWEELTHLCSLLLTNAVNEEIDSFLWQESSKLCRIFREIPVCSSFTLTKQGCFRISKFLGRGFGPSFRITSLGFSARIRYGWRWSCEIRIEAMSWNDLIVEAMSGADRDTDFRVPLNTRSESYAETSWAESTRRFVLTTLSKATPARNFQQRNTRKATERNQNIWSTFWILNSPSRKSQVKSKMGKRQVIVTCRVQRSLPWSTYNSIFQRSTSEHWKHILNSSTIEIISRLCDKSHTFQSLAWFLFLHGFCELRETGTNLLSSNWEDSLNGFNRSWWSCNHTSCWTVARVGHNDNKSCSSGNTRTCPFTIKTSAKFSHLAARARGMPCWR